MNGITEVDREAARVLRETLADICGFWHRTDDDGPLCQALARHRIEAEQRLSLKLAPFLMPPAIRLPATTASERVRSLPQFEGVGMAEGVGMTGAHHGPES